MGTRELLNKPIEKLTDKEFKVKWDMLKYDMNKLNLIKQSKSHLIEIMKLYREFKNEKQKN